MKMIKDEPDTNKKGQFDPVRRTFLCCGKSISFVMVTKQVKFCPFCGTNAEGFESAYQRGMDAVTKKIEELTNLHLKLKTTDES